MVSSLTRALTLLRTRRKSWLLALIAYSTNLLPAIEHAVHEPSQSPWARWPSSSAGVICVSVWVLGLVVTWQILIVPSLLRVTSAGQLVFPKLSGAPQFATSPLALIGVLLHTHMGTEKVRTSVALVPVLSLMVTCIRPLPSSPDSSSSIATRCMVLRKTSCRRICVSVADQANCPASSAEYMPARITAKISVVTNSSTIVKPRVCRITCLYIVS